MVSQLEGFNIKKSAPKNQKYDLTEVFFLLIKTLLLKEKSIHYRTSQTDEVQRYKNRIRTLEKDYENLEVKYEKLKTETLRLKSKNNQEQN